MAGDCHPKSATRTSSRNQVLVLGGCCSPIGFRVLVRSRISNAWGTAIARTSILITLSSTHPRVGWPVWMRAVDSLNWFVCGPISDRNALCSMFGDGALRCVGVEAHRRVPGPVALDHHGIRSCDLFVARGLYHFAVMTDGDKAPDLKGREQESHGGPVALARIADGLTFSSHAQLHRELMHRSFRPT